MSNCFIVNNPAHVKMFMNSHVFWWNISNINHKVTRDHYIGHTCTTSSRRLTCHFSKLSAFCEDIDYQITTKMQLIIWSNSGLNFKNIALFKRLYRSAYTKILEILETIIFGKKKTRLIKHFSRGKICNKTKL